jgi:rhamnogalacturonan acetylesterase
MRFSSFIPLSCIALGVSASPAGLAERAGPTVYLAGDSTMAPKGANNGVTDGNFPSNLAKCSKS